MLLELFVFISVSLGVLSLMVMLTYTLTLKEVKTTDIINSLIGLVAVGVNIVIARCAVKGLQHWIKPEKFKIFKEEKSEIDLLCNDIRDTWYKHKFKYFDEYEAGENDREWNFTRPDRLEFINKVDLLKRKLEYLNKIEKIHFPDFENKMQREYDKFYRYIENYTDNNPIRNWGNDPIKDIPQIKKAIEDKYLELINK